MKNQQKTTTPALMNVIEMGASLLLEYKSQRKADGREHKPKRLNNLVHTIASANG